MKYKKKKEMSLAELIQEMKSDQFLLKYEYAIHEVEKTVKRIVFRQKAKGEHQNIEYITSRIKSPESIVDKLRRKEKPINIKSAEKNLNDIAGVCIVCCYYEDVYQIAKELSEQANITVIKKKDFIRTPKESGYRSLHVIVGLTDDLNQVKRKVKVEIQIRTVTMDAWARLDHELSYKRDYPNAGTLYRDLQACADTIAAVDDKMQQIREQIKKIN